MLPSLDSEAAHAASAVHYVTLTSEMNVQQHLA
jgi:hypothetical protein